MLFLAFIHETADCYIYIHLIFYDTVRLSTYTQTKLLTFIVFTSVVLNVMKALCYQRLQNNLHLTPDYRYFEVLSAYRYPKYFIYIQC